MILLKIHTKLNFKLLHENDFQSSKLIFSELIRHYEDL